MVSGRVCGAGKDQQTKWVWKSGYTKMGGGKEVWCVIVGKDLSKASKSSYTRGYLGVWAKGLGFFVLLLQMSSVRGGKDSPHTSAIGVLSAWILFFCFITPGGNS